MSEWWDRIEALPLRVESYELSGHDREYGSFTRPSTLIHLRGLGADGVGEDVVYDVLDHIAHRDAGPVHDFSAVATLGGFCELVGELDLFGVAEPGMPASRHYRRWAFESAALDLALRQAGVPFHEAVGRDPQPLEFVCSTRLTSFDAEAGSSTEPIRKRLAKYPGLGFKLDPENDWTPELIAEIGELAPVRVLDLKGHYRGTPVDVETDPELYRQVAEAFPGAYLEDPDVNAETRELLEPLADRVTWDAPLHSLADITALEWTPKAINSKPSRFGSLQELFAIYEHCAASGIAIYGGGQGEVEVGRGQIQYLASLFHAGTPNDTAPSGYNDPAVPAGSDQRLEGQGRVAQPAVAVVPVALAPEVLRQRGGRRGDDAAGVHVREAAQGDQAAHHLAAPLPVVLAGVRPGLLLLEGVLEVRVDVEVLGQRAVGRHPRQHEVEGLPGLHLEGLLVVAVDGRRDAGSGQHQLVGPGDRHQRLVPLDLLAVHPWPDPAVVEAHDPAVPHRHGAAHALHPTYDVGAPVAGRHQVGDAHLALLGGVRRLQDRCVVDVATLRRVLPVRSQQPVPVLLLAQQGREARRRVERGQAQPVQGPVDADQGSRVAVADGGVVLDRQRHAGQASEQRSRR